MLIACDNIDKLLCVEMRRPGLPRGFKWPLYEIARSRLSEPMVLAAARLLDRPPATVGIVTGAAVPKHMPKGENDGPFGAVALAQALNAIGHCSTVYTDAECAPAIVALLARYEFDTPVITVARKDDAEQEGIAEACDILVAIERLGGNINGNIHGVTGVSRDGERANFDHLFAHAQRLGKATIGIGDGGNEIGFGNIHAELSENWTQYAAKDKTPCGGGIFTVVETDVLVVASTSNLGAYAVIGALAMLRKDATLCHDPDEEVALHYIGVGLGLIDGGSGLNIPWCDGIPAESNAAVVRLIQNIVEITLLEKRERPF
jgi:hypothetical protein